MKDLDYASLELRLLAETKPPTDLRKQSIFTRYGTATGRLPCTTKRPFKLPGEPLMKNVEEFLKLDLTNLNYTELVPWARLAFGTDSVTDLLRMLTDLSKKVQVSVVDRGVEVAVLGEKQPAVSPSFDGAVLKAALMAEQRAQREQRAVLRATQKEEESAVPETWKWPAPPATAATFTNVIAFLKLDLQEPCDLEKWCLNMLDSVPSVGYALEMLKENGWRATVDMGDAAYTVEAHQKGGNKRFLRSIHGDLSKAVLRTLLKALQADMLHAQQKNQADRELAEDKELARKTAAMLRRRRCLNTAEKLDRLVDADFK